MRLHRTDRGAVVERDGSFHDVAGDWDDLLADDELAAYLRATCANVPGAPELEHVSSSLVKEVARFGGDVTGLVPDEVRDALVARRPSP